MNPSLQLFLSILVPVLGVGTTFLINRRQLRQSAPKDAAEADQAQAASTLANITATAKAVDLLTGENTRLGAQVEKLTGRLATVESACDRTTDENDALKRRLVTLEASLDSSYEQNTLLDKQLRAAEATVKALRTQNRILIAHLRLFSDWAMAYYNAEHPHGMPPPPQMLSFEEVP